jgi:tellurite resistance protein TerC
MATLHIPAWAWAVTIAAVGVLLAADLLVSYRRNRPVRLAEEAWWTLATIVLAVAFGALLAISSGGTAAGQFFAGWLTEYSLSLDNLLVFIILISRFKVPSQLQGRVVLAGILFALVLRGGVIALGAAALSKFQWVEYLFGAFLIYTAAELASRRRLGDTAGAATPADHRPPAEPPAVAKLFLPADRPSPPGDRPRPGVLRGSGARLAARLSRNRRVTPLVMLVIALGITDVVFALDSIPAIFGLTRDPFLVFSANVFALLGLRHLYFLAGGLLSRLAYLPAGIAVVLSFIGVKLIAEALRGDGVTRIGPVPVPAISAWLSLVIIVVVLGVTALASVTATRRRARTDPAASSPPAEVRPRRWRRGGRPRRPRREPSPSRRWPEP